jgi:hypothetical protein
MKRLTKSLFFEKKLKKLGKNTPRNSQMGIRKKFLRIKPFNKAKQELQVKVDPKQLLKRTDKRAEQYIQIFKGVRSITSDKNELGLICEWLNTIFNKQMRNISKELFGRFRLNLFKKDEKKMRILNELQVFKTNITMFIPSIIEEYFLQFIEDCQEIGRSTSSSSSIQRSRTPKKRKISPFSKSKIKKKKIKRRNNKEENVMRSKSNILAKSQVYNENKKMVGRIAHSKSSEFNKSNNVFKEKSFRYLELNNSESIQLQTRMKKLNNSDSDNGKFKQLNLSPIKMKNGSQESEIFRCMNEFNFETMNDTFSKDPRVKKKSKKSKIEVKKIKKKIKINNKKQVQSKMQIQFKKKFGLNSSLRSPYPKHSFNTFRRLNKKNKISRKTTKIPSKIKNQKGKEPIMINLNIFNNNQQETDSFKNSKDRKLQSHPQKMDDFLNNMNNLGLVLMPTNTESIYLNERQDTNKSNKFNNALEEVNKEDINQQKHLMVMNADIYGSKTYMLDKKKFLQKQALKDHLSSSHARFKNCVEDDKNDFKKNEEKPRKSTTKNLRNLADKNKNILDLIKYPHFGGNSNSYGGNQRLS